MLALFHALTCALFAGLAANRLAKRDFFFGGWMAACSLLAVVLYIKEIWS